jgi:hypothetical protein
MATATNEKKPIDWAVQTKAAIGRAASSAALHARTLVLGTQEAIVAKGETKDVEDWSKGLREIAAHYGSTSPAAILMCQVTNHDTPDDTSQIGGIKHSVQMPIYRKNVSLINEQHTAIDPMKHVIIDQLKVPAPYDHNNPDVDPATNTQYTQRRRKYTKEQVKDFDKRWQEAKSAVKHILLNSVKDDKNTMFLTNVNDEMHNNPYLLYDFLKEKAKFTGQQLRNMKNFLNWAYYAKEHPSKVTPAQMKEQWTSRMTKTKESIETLFLSKKLRNLHFEVWLLQDTMRYLTVIQKDTQYYSYVTSKTEDFNKMRQLLIRHEPGTIMQDPEQALAIQNRARVPSHKALLYHVTKFRNAVYEFGQHSKFTPIAGHDAKVANFQSNGKNKQRDGGKAKATPQLCMTCWAHHDGQMVRKTT